MHEVFVEFMFARSCNYFFIIVIINACEGFDNYVAVMTNHLFLDIVLFSNLITGLRHFSSFSSRG